LAKGIDNTPVQTEQEAKSFGEETTLEKDTQDLNILKIICWSLQLQ
jgi:impB/mucB/samB family C-terminal.